MPRPMTALLAAAVLGAALAGPVQAQPSKDLAPTPLRREILQTFDVPSGRYEARIGTSALGANQSGGRQVHPGPEAGYVLRGEATMLVDGRPPLRLEAGQSYQLAPGVAHELRSGPHGVTLLITWVLEQGKPFESPAD